jgi:hypothetical protein
VLACGATTAIIAVLIGMTVSRPAADGMAAVAKEIEAAGGKPTDTQAATAAALRGKLVIAARVQTVLVVFTVLMMAIARYVS